MDTMPSDMLAGAARELFERRGLRCTRQRELIYNALASMKTHPTAEELFSSVRAVECGLSLATVYNTLEAFTECGLARRLPCPSGAGACRFDADTSEHVHIAHADGRLADLPPDLSERLLGSVSPELVAELERRLGVRIGGLSIQVVARSGQARPGAGS